MSDKVIVHEVGLRDGLQNQPRLVPVEGKLKMLDAMIAAGIRSIETTSFVSPKAVPQMADAAELYARLPDDRGLNFEALVPNEKGYERAVEAGAKTIALVLAATEGLNRKNINMSLDEAIRVNVAVIKRPSAKASGRALTSPWRPPAPMRARRRPRWCSISRRACWMPAPTRWPSRIRSAPAIRPR